MLHCGIIGLPLSGKSTVFNVITRAGAEVKPYAGGKTDPNKAVVPVPDKRFDALVEIHAPRKETPAQVEFVDLAGLSRGAGKGEGLGNAFLSFVADADALIHVIRCFANSAGQRADLPRPRRHRQPPFQAAREEEADARRGQGKGAARKMLRLPHGGEAAFEHRAEARGDAPAARIRLRHLEAADNPAQPRREPERRNEDSEVGRAQEARRGARCEALHALRKPRNGHHGPRARGGEGVHRGAQHHG